MLLHLLLKRLERDAPELIEIGPQGRKAGGVKLIDPPCALGTVSDQARLFEHTQMLRDRWTADGELFGELADSQGPVQKMVNDGAPGWVAEGVQLLCGFYVRIHLR